MNASSVVILFFTAVAAGYLLGKVRIGGITPGSSGVLIVSVIIGAAISAFGSGTGEAAGSFSLLSSLGTALFVSCIGLSAGSSFSLGAKRRGIMCFLIGAGTTLVAFLFILAISRVFETDRSVLLGILCGALTTTPALSALSGIEGVSQPLASAGYGAAYLFGVTVTVAAVQIADRAGKRSPIKRSTTETASEENRTKRSETEKSTDRISNNEDAKCRRDADSDLKSGIVSTLPCVSNRSKKTLCTTVESSTKLSRSGAAEDKNSEKRAKVSTEPCVSKLLKKIFSDPQVRGADFIKTAVKEGKNHPKSGKASTAPRVSYRTENNFSKDGDGTRFEAENTKFERKTTTKTQRVSTEPCVSFGRKKIFSNSVTFGADQPKKAGEEGEESQKTAKSSTDPGVSNEPKNNFSARAAKGENSSKAGDKEGVDRQKRTKISTPPGVSNRLINLFLHCSLTEPNFKKFTVKEGKKSQNAAKVPTLPGVSKSAKTTGELSVFGTVALISVTAVSGSLLGKIKIPFAGVGLGSSGGILIVGFFSGALFKASGWGIPRKNTVDPLRMLGLFMFFIGSGVPAGEAVGAVITPFNAALGMAASLIAVSFACVTAKLTAGKNSANAPSVIGGAMTSTPALNILTEQGLSPPDTVAYSAAYLGALFTAVVGIRALAALM